MADIANVLVGKATLSIRQPNDALAEWSTAQRHVGNYAAKLYKGGSGNDGSTHIQFTPAGATTVTQWTAGIVNNSFWNYCQALLANWMQFEFRFEDPNSDAWLEITAVPMQTYLGTGAWVQRILALATPCGYGGVGELGASFFNWGPLTAANGVQAAVDADPAVDTCADWILSRIRIELWEATPERTGYVDTVTVMGVTYAIEPGATTPGLSLSSPFTEVGYTEDGVQFEYNADTFEAMVDEETFPVQRVITTESIQITCNLAEASMVNLNTAMAGSVLSGNILTFGNGVMKEMNVKLEGIDPDGFLCAIMLPRVTASGTVGVPYRKGAISVIPLTLQALKPATGNVCSVVYNEA